MTTQIARWKGAAERRRSVAGLLAAGLMASAGCARDNPLFGTGGESGTTTQNGDSTDATARTSTTDDSTSKAAASDTAGTVDSTGHPYDLGNSTGPKTSESEPGSEVGSDSDGSSGETLPAKVVVFATPRTDGVFGGDDESAWGGAVAHCVESLSESELDLRCETIWPFLSVDGVPLEALPDRPGGEALATATIVGPDAVPIAASFAALAAGTVSVQLQPSVTDHLDVDATIQAWTGDPDVPAQEGTCANWVSAEAEGVVRAYSNTADFVITSMSPCSQPFHVLCLCF